MIKKLLFFVLLLCLSGSLFAEINVKTFRKLETDLDARLNESIKDQNGDLCAIIKVVTSQTGFTFDCGQIGIMKTVQKTGEIWVYVPFSTKRITIAHPVLGFLRDYMFPMSVEKATVYELVLTTDKVVTIIEKNEMDTQWLLIDTDPIGADVYINDQPVGKTPYQNEFPIGKYTYRLQKDQYINDVGIVELKPGDQKQIIKSQLKPNYGTVQITSTPENGAKVSLNGIPTGKTTPCNLETVPAGDHTLKVSCDFYETTSQRITIIPGETKQVVINMNPAFSEVTLQSDPKADIYINGIFKANGSWQGRLTPAVYSFEAKLEKYSTASENKTIEIGIPVNITLKPKPRTGNLKVISTPFEATVKLNGELMGQTPVTLRKLITGDYTVELSRQGYLTKTETVTVNEGITNILNSTLTYSSSESAKPENPKPINSAPVIKTITERTATITSNPTGATVSIDGIFVGKTPYNGVLTIGSHNLLLQQGIEKINKTVTIEPTRGETEFNLTFAQKAFEQSMNAVIENKEAPSLDREVSIGSSPTGASLFIDSKLVGHTPYTGKLNFGNHSVRIEQNNLKSEKNITVSQYGGETDFTLILEQPLKTETNTTLTEVKLTPVQSNPVSSDLTTKKKAKFKDFASLGGQIGLNSATIFDIGIGMDIKYANWIFSKTELSLSGFNNMACIGNFTKKSSLFGEIGANLDLLGLSGATGIALGLGYGNFRSNLDVRIITGGNTIFELMYRLGF